MATKKGKKDVFSSLESNFMARNDWTKVLRAVMNKRYFGTKFYEMFFLFSHGSRDKFKSLKDQAKTFVRMLQLILDKTTAKEERHYYKNMRRAHRKHNVSLQEIKAMQMALVAVVMVYLVDKNELNEFNTVKQGIADRFVALTSAMKLKKSSTTMVHRNSGS